MDSWDVNALLVTHKQKIQPHSVGCKYNPTMKTGFQGNFDSDVDWVGLNVNGFCCWVARWILGMPMHGL